MSEQEPAFRVTRGTPTAEELAALVGVMLLRSRPSATVPAPRTSTWARHSRPGIISSTGLPTQSGVDSWRLSALPR
jgi:hypothetical protein